MKKILALFSLLVLAACQSQTQNRTFSERNTPLQPPTAPPLATLIPTPTKTPEAITPFTSCQDEQIFYSAFPLQLDDLMGIIPLGNLNPPSHTFPTQHMYFWIRRQNPADPQSAPVEVPLSAPGDMVITEIRYSKHASENPPYVDYGVIFRLCDEVSGYFYHVTSLSPEIEILLESSQYDDYSYATGGKFYESRTYRVEIPIPAGTQIGTAGGREGQNALDFGTIDTRQPEYEFANLEIWRAYSQMLHIVCPLDYYPTDMRDALEPYLGSPWENIARKEEPLCGTVAQDIPGTAQGIWLFGENLYPEDTHLALVHDNVDPTQPVISTGHSLEASGLAAGKYIFELQSAGYVNRDFKDVLPDGHLYCYEPRYHYQPDRIPSTIILMQLIDDETLKVERISRSACGEGPWEFGDSYTVFSR